jgi:hypothetical protein
MIIQDTVLAAWKTGRKTRTASKGWITGNAVCCPHNGESQDTRGRGGLIINGDGTVSFHCFNCQFKASYVPGYALPFKFQKLLKWLGVDDLEIYRLKLEALREAQRQEALGLVKPVEKKEDLKVEFKKVPLPEESVSFLGMVEFYELKDNSHIWPADFTRAITYVNCRSINMQKYDFYVTDITEHKLNKRVIVPFTWNNEIIGYTARATIDGITPKYYNQFDSGYVFNVDKQLKNQKFVIVCEGVFDALSIDAVAVMKAEVTKQQVDIIENLDREIIVVPDWNKTGQNLVDIALAHGWSVSFPVWSETCSDINDAVIKYGKLFVLKTIVDSVETSELKIKLMRRKFA